MTEIDEHSSDLFSIFFQRSRFSWRFNSLWIQELKIMNWVKSKDIVILKADKDIVVVILVISAECDCVIYGSEWFLRYKHRLISSFPVCKIRKSEVTFDVSYIAFFIKYLVLDKIWRP